MPGEFRLDRAFSFRQRPRVMPARRHPWIALVLTGHLLLGGFAGLSPLLHVWLEHGGHGPAHVHHGAGKPVPVGAQISAGESSPVEKPIHVAIRPAAQRTHEFKLPRLSFAKLWHRWLHDLATQTESDSPSNDNQAHQHDSLAQTLVNGLLDVATTEIVVPGFTLREFPLPSAADDFLLKGVFGPHAFERGPPGFSG